MLATPPYPYLKQVADHCPKCVSLYMELWNKRDSKDKVAVYKKDIKTYFLTSPTRFKNELLMIVREGLASIDESPNMLVIELVGYDYNFDEEGNEYE